MLAQGGLGNMLFQIAFGVNQALKNSTDFSVVNYIENSREIKGLHNSKPSDYLNNIFEKVSQNCVPFVSENKYYFHNIDHFEYKSIEYFPEFSNVYKGYFQSYKFFLENDEVIKSLFEPKKEIIDQILKKYPKIADNSVSIHIRRGDYLYRPHHHPVLPIKYYNDTLSTLNNQNVFVFSDDIQWCVDNFDKSFNFVREPDWLSLYMMSLSDSLIIANSSLSWWAAKLASWRNENIKVYRPSIWFGPALQNHNLKDMFPDNWNEVKI